MDISHKSCDISPKIRWTSFLIFIITNFLNKKIVINKNGPIAFGKNSNLYWIISKNSAMEDVSLFFNFEKILQVPSTYLQASAIYFQDFQKFVEYIPQLLQDKEGVLEYIPQLFENNAGVVEYIPQLLHYSINCPPKSWWTNYIKETETQAIEII